MNNAQSLVSSLDNKQLKVLLYLANRETHLRAKKAKEDTRIGNLRLQLLASLSKNDRESNK